MALRRFRVAHTRDRYVILDHGRPAGTVDLTPAPGNDFAGAGKTVPRYRQDGDPASAETSTWIVWSSDPFNVGDVEAQRARQREAMEECNRRNAEYEEQAEEHDEILSDLDYTVEADA